MVHVSISHLERVLEDSYLVSCFRSAWEDMGWTVSVGRRFHEMSDLCILHHDVTRLDPLRLPEPPVGVPVLNGKVLDISKRRLSGILLKEGDDWDGPVIVKTDLNHFGGPEFRYMSKSASPGPCASAAQAHELGGSSATIAMALDGTPHGLCGRVPFCLKIKAFTP